MHWRRSTIAIGTGLLVAAALLQLTVDPIEAGTIHILEGGGRRAGLDDWLFVAAATALRVSPFVAATFASAFLARDARGEHGLITLNLALVLWALLSR